MQFMRSPFGKFIAVAALGMAAVGSAHARDVYWSVGVNAAPGVAVGVGNVRPVVVAPQPVYVAPQVVYQQPQVVYQQPQVVYAQPQYVYPSTYYVQPAPVVIYPRHRHWHGHGGHWR